MDETPVITVMMTYKGQTSTLVTSDTWSSNMSRDIRPLYVMGQPQPWAWEATSYGSIWKFEIREGSKTVHTPPQINVLEQFLYFLMRDHLPVGVIPELLRDCAKATDPTYTNKQLAELAAVYAQAIRTGQLPDYEAPRD